MTPEVEAQFRRPWTARQGGWPAPTTYALLFVVRALELTAERTDRAFANYFHHRVACVRRDHIDPTQRRTMSAYSGPQGRGAARRRRAEKRAQAQARDLLTLPERRRQARLTAAAA